MKADVLIAAARKYLGVPFGHRGRSARRLDCWGLVRLSCDDVGALPGVDHRSYGPMPPPDLMLNTLSRTLSQVLKDEPGLSVEQARRRVAIRKPVEKLAPGDIAVLGMGRGAFLAAIVTQLPEGLGAIYCGQHGVVEHLLDQPLRRRVRACFRIPEIEEEADAVAPGALPA